MNTKPDHWFRPVSEAWHELDQEPDKIEYLKVWTGETFIHVGGTAYWKRPDGETRGYLDVDALNRSGITHWRLC